MKQFTAALLLAALSVSASAATVYTAPYGVQNEFEFEIWSTDGLSLDVDETDGGTDVTVRCNDAAEATATNDYTDEGTTYRIVLTATEMQCELITVTVNEAVDAVFHIQTIDNASARLPQLNANVTQFGGTNGTFASGRPEVNTTHAAGTAWNSGAIGANTLASDTITAAKAAADLTTELQAGLATASSLTTVGNNVSTLLEALVVLGAEQTADSGTTTTIVDAALTQATDGWFNGMAVHFTSGTLLGQASCATGFTASSDTLTFSPAVTTAVTTHTYYLLPDAECVTGDSFARLGAPAGASIASDLVVIDNFTDDLESRLGTPSNLGGGATVAANLSDIEGQTDDIGTAGAGLTNIDLPNQTMDITGTLSTVTAVTNMVTANMTQVSGDSAAADALELHYDGTAGVVPGTGIQERGTAQAGAAGTITLRSGASSTDDYYNCTTVDIVAGTGAGQAGRSVSDYVGSTKVASITPNWTTTPDSTSVYEAWGTACASGGGTDVNVVTIEGTDATTVLGTAQTGDAYARLGAPAGASVSADILAVDNFVDDLESRLGTPSNLGGGATVAANLSDIEGQTDDIGAAGAGLTALPDVDLLVEAQIPLGTELTADSGTTTTIVDAALTQATDGWFNGSGVVFTSGTLAGQTACVTNFTASSDTLTFSPATTATVGTQNYYLLATPECQSGDAFARLGAPAGASVSADVADLRADIPTALVSGRMDASVGAMAANVITDAASATDFEARLQTEADDALVARDLHFLLDTTYDPTAEPAADSLLGDLTESDGGVTRFTLNALEQAPAGGGGTADWNADERTAIRSILGIPASGTTPDDPTTGILDTTRDAVAGVQSDTNDIQTRLPAALVSGRMDSSTGAMAANVMTAAAAAGDLTTELQSGLATASALDAIDNFVDTEVATLVTNVGTPSNLGSGATLAANNADIEAQTDDIGVAGAGLTAVDDAALAAIAALNNISPAQVQSEAEDAINARLEQQTRLDAAVLNCEVNTANFAGSTLTLACIVTDRDGSAVTLASGDLAGRELLVLSGAQQYEGRYINSTTWDSANSELRLTLARVLPGTLADAVTAVIR